MDKKKETPKRNGDSKNGSGNLWYIVLVCVAVFFLAAFFMQRN
jgi:hypothetical protein